VLRSRLATVTAAATAIAAALAVPAITPARAAAQTPSAVTALASVGTLNGVAATSAGNAWAVGNAILHWNGRTWATADASLSGTLDAVTAPSAGNVWAVGATEAGKALVMRWNGRSWSRVGGVPQVTGTLNAVAATANSVWAVGGAGVAGNGPAFILHRTGGRWYVVPLPSPADSFLLGVGMAANGTAWAVGHTGFALPNGKTYSLLLRWSGAVWKPVSAPSLGANVDLMGVAVSPTGAAWAVGFGGNVQDDEAYPVSLRWTGKSWQKIRVVAPPGITQLDDVAFIPGGTAFAVGGTVPSRQPQAPIIVHWTGRAWTRMKSPGPGFGSFLYSVAATSPSNAWAVGQVFSKNGPPRFLILHWNGKTWAQV
jgi:hypothetical protein